MDLEESYLEYNSITPMPIIYLNNNMVEKKSRGIQQQMRIHSIVQRILQGDSYNYIRVPLLPITSRYLMQRVSTRRPLILGSSCNCRSFEKIDVPAIIEELTRLFIDIWVAGYAAFGFELFVQPDGTVVLLGFDKFRVCRNKNGVPILVGPETFFNHSCFPVGPETFFNHSCFPVGPETFFNHSCFPVGLRNRIQTEF